MYLVTIYNDGVANVIHEPGTSEVKVDNGQISREKSAFSSFSFDVFPGNPGWDDLTPFATTVKVTNTRTGETDFDGRVIQIVPSMDDSGMISRSVTCEDCMGYLCDSHQLYEEEEHYAGSGSKSGLQVYIEKLLTRHNATMPDDKKIYAGNITLQTFETSDGVTKSISRGTTWENIKDKLLDVFGGEMRVRRASDGNLYLDYAEHLGQTRATKIELTRNMISSESEMDPGQVITRLYPYGSKITVTEEDPDTGEDVERETEDRIGIEDVNGGLPYIDDVVAIEQYGIIEGYQEWDDITQPQNLLNTAQEWLGANNAVPVTFTLDAVDLSLLGIDIDEFTIYDSYPCYNPLIGLDETLEIVKQVININEPEASTFDMGESAFRLSNDLSNNATKGDVQYLQSQIQTNITNVNNRVVMNQAYIAIMEDRINQNVSQTITTTVSGAVNVTNPSFETGDMSGWTVSGSDDAYVNDTQPIHGDYKLVVSYSAAGTITIVNDSRISVSEGQKFRLSAYIWTDSDLSTSSLGFLADTGATITKSVTFQGGGWYFYSQIVTIPSGIHDVRFRLASQVGASGNIRVDACSCLDVTDGNNAQEEIDGLAIGGTNLIRNSNFASGVDFWVLGGGLTSSDGSDDTFSSYREFVHTESYPDQRIYPATDTFMHAAGETYALSFYAKANAAATIRAAIGGWAVIEDFRLTTSWQKFTKVYTASGAGSLSFYLLAAGTYQITNIKLELGNRCTSWSPAPEDQTDYTDNSVNGVYDAVDDVNGTLETVQNGLQAANDSLEKLNATVTETITKTTNLEQTAEGWDFQFETIRETVTYLDNTMQTNFTETLKYIRFIDGEIWLGKEPEAGEDDFKVVISNERVRFLQNNVEVAYLSNKMLYITDARVTNRLEIGNFAFYPRSNGSLTLRLIN